MKFETTITSKGTITIAAPIRKALGLKAGQKVKLELDEKNHRILMDTGTTIEQLEMLRDEILRKLPRRKPLTGKALKEAAAKAWVSGYKQ
ncbi:MAG TPA: AbrB/MazE/SpoVT family DNA-binding domain-containing protein [Pyrinomonadaceae bacterium]|nr:AbrB/MazE/SpoVT family DNA-binding domain-containing protein [Pyrinomonadaceae bacterium]